MTKIGLIRINKKKQIKLVRYHIFFPTQFLVHRKVRCPPKISPKLGMGCTGGHNENVSI